MQIALDAMGGDHAPEAVVAGAVQAVSADPGLGLFSTERLRYVPRTLSLGSVGQHNGIGFAESVPMLCE